MAAASRQPAPSGTQRMDAGRALAALVPILLAGFALRTAWITVDRFHADEALYAGWARLISEGDPWLVTVPVDKPPLYLYTLALAARTLGASELALRIPNLAANTLGIAAIYQLGRRLYGRSTGVWAALFVALAPFDILFARTAFTDPTLALWTMLALVAAARGRWFAAGMAAGLAFASKQHAVVLIPLVVAIGLIQQPAPHSGRRERGPHPRLERLGSMWKGGLGFAIPFGLVMLWDSARWAIRPGFWEQSAMSYGGLAWAPPGEWIGRLGEWLGWAWYLLPSPLLIGVLVAGSALLLDRSARRGSCSRALWLDAILAAYAAGYLVIHAVFEFSIWDRYLLPLVIPTTLLLARAVERVPAWCAALLSRATAWNSTASLTRVRQAWTVLVLAAALLPAWRAAHNGYPIGGEHWAYQGIEQVVAYLRDHAPPDAVIYHHWLRWHYEYYVRDTSYELRWWESGEHLRREVLRTPERTQYLVLPDWGTLRPDAKGITLVPVFEAHRADGSVSMRVYLIEAPAT